MGRKKRSSILVVDDNPINLRLLRNILKTNGYNSVTAENGIQALEMVKQGKLDLILLDVMMPEMDGYEVCRRLKQDPEAEKIPVIFLTAQTETKDIIKGFEVGGVDYITKPFVSEVVFARINAHLKLNEAVKRLEEMSVTDELTGVFNRRYAYEVLERQISICKRERTSFVVCYVDIDNLKKINDSYGHTEGDKLITKVADSLKRIVRVSDYLFRMGGDEFMLVFPKARLKESHNLITRLREKLSQQSIRGNPIDFSYGFSEFNHKDSLLPDELINIADTRMYQSKQAKKSETG